MSITRLSGGLTPADGDDPRTFPTIFNGAADLVESTATSLSVLTPRVTALENTSTVLNFYTATKTGEFVWIEGESGGGVDIPELSIAGVAVSNASNRLLIMGFVGATASSGAAMSVGLSVSDGSNLLSIGDSAGSRGRTTSGGPLVPTGATGSGNVVNSQHISIVHTPGDTTARTYRLRIINLSASSRTLFVNRSLTDTNSPFGTRTASAIHIMEIAA